MIEKKLIFSIAFIVLTLTACSSNKPPDSSQGTDNTKPVATSTTQISNEELNSSSSWKTVTNDSRFFKFSMNVPPSARYYFSPDTTMGTENGVFIGEDRFPYGLTIEYNALNDRDSRTVTYKADYTKSQPSDIDFGVQGAVMSQGTNTRGLTYTRYLVRKDPNLYVLSISTKNQTYIEAYKNMIKTFKVQ